MTHNLTNQRPFETFSKKFCPLSTTGPSSVASAITTDAMRTRKNANTKRRQPLIVLIVVAVVIFGAVCWRKRRERRRRKDQTKLSSSPLNTPRNTQHKRDKCLPQSTAMEREELFNRYKKRWVWGWQETGSKTLIFGLLLSSLSCGVASSCDPDPLPLLPSPASSSPKGSSISS